MSRGSGSSRGSATLALPRIGFFGVARFVFRLARVGFLRFPRLLLSGSRGFLVRFARWLGVAGVLPEEAAEAATSLDYS